KLEVVVAADAVGSAGFVGNGEAQGAVLPADSGVLVQDGAVNFMGARGRGPHDVSVLEGIIATVLSRTRLVGGGVAQDAALPADAGPFAADGAVDLVSARGRCPVDRTVLEVVVAADAVGGAGLV